MKKANQSGCLNIEKSDIIYSVGEKESWRLPIARVQVIGEYTTANGPFIDDYFLVFVTDEADRWYEASYYAQGGDAFRLNLSKQLGDEIRFGLNKSTDWKHRVLWPKSLEGVELFNVLPATKAKSFWGRLRQKLLTRKTIELSKSVRELCHIR